MDKNHQPHTGCDSVAGLEMLRAIDLVLACPLDTEPHTAKGTGFQHVLSGQKFFPL